MDIKAKEIKMVPVDGIIENPKNNNRHSIEQIERLAKIIEHNGFRDPLIISKRSGFLIAGHGRLEAAKKLGMDEVPCTYQDFESEAEEYQFLTAHNQIARWAELDFQSVYEGLKEFPEIELDLLGIENFKPEKIEEYDLDEIDLKSDPEGYTIKIEIEDPEEANEIYEGLLAQGLPAKLINK